VVGLFNANFGEKCSKIVRAANIRGFLLLHVPMYQNPFYTRYRECI
jgi:hypothetical protein